MTAARGSEAVNKPLKRCTISLVSVRHYDVVVIGCGAMGSSASYHLASRGMRTLTLEQFDLGHTRGSSHGETRIIRTAYSEDPRYVPLVQRAFELWRRLQKKSGRKILRMTGGLMIGPAQGTLVSGALKSAREHGLGHEILSSRDAMRRFGIFDLVEAQSAVYEEEAGILFPENCVEAHVSLAKQAGCEFRFREACTGWKSTREGVELETAGGSYLADRVVISAGSWTAPFLDDLIPLSCERQVPFWFSPRENGRFGADAAPVFIIEELDGRIFYGIPDVGHGVKVARHHGGEFVSPGRINSRVTELDARPVKAGSYSSALVRDTASSFRA
jgi:sarcosine oxidase